MTRGSGRRVRGQERSPHLTQPLSLSRAQAALARKGGPPQGGFQPPTAAAKEVRAAGALPHHRGGVGCCLVEYLRWCAGLQWEGRRRDTGETPSTSTLLPPDPVFFFWRRTTITTASRAVMETRACRSSLACLRPTEASLCGVGGRIHHHRRVARTAPGSWSPAVKCLLADFMVFPVLRSNSIMKHAALLFVSLTLFLVCFSYRIVELYVSCLWQATVTDDII